jgi:translation initiation factor IF-2
LVPIIIGRGKREHELAIRIYQLAKQLKIDNKALVDVCKKLGIAGKGSALASLSDDQVAAIKEHLSGSKKPTPLEPETSAVPIREEKTLGRVRTLPPTSRTVQETSPQEPETATLEPVAEIPAAPAVTPTTPQVPDGPPSVTPTPPARPAGAVRREDYIGPGGVADKKIPVLGSSPAAPKRPAENTDRLSASADKSGPSIKLAPMPTAKAPPRKKEQEPRAQKPDLKLPPGAIKAGRAGAKPLSDHLRKHEKTGKGSEKSGHPAASVPTGAGEETGKDRIKKGKRPAGLAEDSPGTLGGREQRQLKRKRAAVGRRRRDDDDGPASRQVRRLRRTGNASTAAPRKSKVVLTLPCTVKSFAESLGLSVAAIQGKLFELGKMLTITASLDLETAELLAVALEVEVDFRREMSAEEKMQQHFEEIEDDADSLKPRPPVITFLGHVDHGKTSLLDRIIHTDVVSGEKGGITQHIRAYRIMRGNQPIAFVDTPGHEAFTEMRARGANCTDIAVLVVAADDGVMPQTEEAISHAKAAGVPIVVALNKIDLPGANPDRAFEQLARAELLPSEWGGDVEVVRTSAITGDGIDELLDTLLTVAELHEFAANPDAPGSGVCLEAEVQQGRGVVCKVLVDRGTLRVGDVIVCGSAFGRVKAMYDTLNPRKRHKEAGPSMPVNLTGLGEAPGAGDRFQVLSSVAEARHVAEERAALQRQEDLADTRPHVTLETLKDWFSEQEVQTLNIILRADVRGSIEAIKKELLKLEHPEVQIRILQASVGGITEADVTLADASDGVIIGFNVVPEEGARVLADKRGVQIRRYDIIYQVTEDLKAALEGMLRPEKREADLGRALVQRTFTISRVGTIAGCRVLSGNIQRDCRVRIIRESRVIGDYSLDSLKREKDDAREVREGLECGMKLKGYNDLKEGDILEAYKIEEVARTF